MSYCLLLWEKRLQKYQRSKLEVRKKLPTRPVSNPMHSGPGWSGRFFSTSNFDLWYFCSLLTYKDVQYLVWKIWLISVWRMKAKVFLWLLTWFIFAQRTLILYNTEAFVKTEVGPTVSKVTFAVYVKIDFPCSWCKLYNRLACAFTMYLCNGACQSVSLLTMGKTAKTASHLSGLVLSGSFRIVNQSAK